MSSLQKIRDERAELARQRAALERRDAELAVAEKVLAEFEGIPATELAAISGTERFSMKMPVPTTSTRRELVIEALSGEKVWMTSGEINKAIYKRHRFMIKTSSLYPMLTVLKNETVIVRDGDKMALKSRVKGGFEVQD